MPEHPNLIRLHSARLALDMATRYFRAEVVRCMAEREGNYSAPAVAIAACVSRARLYQIIGEQKAGQS